MIIQERVYHICVPKKPEHDYDIKKIEDLENQGLSIRAVARKMGWPELGTHQWIKRNYIKVIKYVSKKK